MHLYLLSVLMGLTLAMPVGPIAITMIQRTITQSALYGICVGLGAAVADFFYFIALIEGMARVLKHPTLLKGTTLIGAAILCWFAYQTYHSHKEITSRRMKKASVNGCFLQGFLIAALSPFNLVFWASMAAQIAALTAGSSQAIFIALLGFFSGLLGWVLGFNLTLHLTRSRLTDRVVVLLNRISSLILFGFAFYSLWYVFYAQANA